MSRSNTTGLGDGEFISLSDELWGKQASGTRLVLGHFPPSPAAVVPKVAGLKLHKKLAPNMNQHHASFMEKVLFTKKALPELNNVLGNAVALHSGTSSFSPRGCSSYKLVQGAYFVWTPRHPCPPGIATPSAQAHRSLLLLYSVGANLDICHSSLQGCERWPTCWIKRGHVAQWTCVQVEKSPEDPCVSYLFLSACWPVASRCTWVWRTFLFYFPSSHLGRSHFLPPWS